MQHQAARTKIYDVTEGLRTDKTREEYCRAFNAFFRYTNLASKEELLKQDPQDIEEFIIEYLSEYLLKQRHQKYSSITLHKAQFDLK